MRFELNFYELLGREIAGIADETERRKLVAKLYRNSEVLGIQMSPLPERRTNALSLLLGIQIDDPTFLQGGFEKITQENLPDVIEQHRLIVEKLMKNGELPIVLDTRRGAK